MRAVGAAGPSPFAPLDAATTTVFNDASLSGVPIHAGHVMQLRLAINAMGTAAQLPAATFTNDPLTAGTPILRQHVVELGPR